MPLTRESLCPAFVEGKRAMKGRCVCGLVWVLEMPPHLPDGTELTPEQWSRIERREREASEAERRKAELLAEDRARRVLRWGRRSP